MKFLDWAVFVSAIALASIIAWLGIANGIKRAEIGALEVALEQAEVVRSGWEQALGRTLDGLDACQGQWATATLAADEMSAAVQGLRIEVQQQQADWMSRWDERTATCAASLEAMQEACEDELGDY